MNKPIITFDVVVPQGTIEAIQESGWGILKDKTTAAKPSEWLTYRPRQDKTVVLCLTPEGQEAEKPLKVDLLQQHGMRSFVRLIVKRRDYQLRAFDHLEIAKY